MSETKCLKSLAAQVLERLDRNTLRNKNEAHQQNLVSLYEGYETNEYDGFKLSNLSLPDLQEVFEERLAICLIDGQLDLDSAQRNALLAVIQSITSQKKAH